MFQRLALGLLLLVCSATAAQDPSELGGAAPSDSKTFELSDVIVDGRVILKVRGAATYTAARRAAKIRQEIIATAKDESIPASAVTLRDGDDRTLLMSGNRVLLDLFDADAEIEGISREILAEAKQVLVQEAIANYRHDRSPRVLLTKSLYALATTLSAVGLLFGFRKGVRSLDNLVERRMKDHLKALEDFAVTYKLNAHCTDPTNIPQIYSALHRNILDVFNEYGVVIMTPSYEADPPEPKLVLKDQWYTAPAKPPSSSADG